MAPAKIEFGVVIALSEEFERFRRFFPAIPRPRRGNDSLFFQVPGTDGHERNGVVTVVKSMGLSDARAATTKLITAHHPDLVVSIGIAGSLSTDALLGDVVIGTEADDYQHRSKVTTPAATPDAVEFIWGGRSWPATEALIRLVRDLPDIDRRLHVQWQDTTRGKLPSLPALDELRRGSFLKEPVKIVAGPVASGNFVGASQPFKAALLERNRNYVAIDMEAAGVLQACFDANSGYEPKRMILKGISDYADERKSQIDASTKGAVREWAMDNACRLLGIVFASAPSVTPPRRRAPRGQPIDALGRVRQLIADRYLHEPYAGTAKSDADVPTQAFHRLFAPLATSHNPQLLHGDMFATLARFITDSQHGFPLSVDGPPGVGKSTFLSILYLTLARARNTLGESAPIPVYVDLKPYGESATGEQALQKLRGDLALIQQLAAEHPGAKFILLMDGVEEYSATDSDNVSALLETLSSMPNHKKIVAVGLSASEDFRSPEARVSLRAVPVTAARGFVEAYLAVTVSPEDESRVNDRIRALRLAALDLFILSRIVATLDVGRYADATSLSQFLQVHCVAYLEKSKSGSRAGRNLHDAAKLAYQFTIRQDVQPGSEPDSAAAWRLIHQHLHVREFLVAFHVMDQLKVAARMPVGTRFEDLHYVFPQAITLFCRDIVEGLNMSGQRELVVGAFRLMTGNQEQALPLVCYVIGRVKDAEVQHYAREVLSEGKTDIMKRIGARPRPRNAASNQLLLTARTMFISLVMLGNRGASDDLISLMLRDPEWDELNRGFHLEYYGDIPYIPSHQMSHRDALEDFAHTYRGLDERLRRHRRNADYAALDVEFYTLLSLAQHRHAAGRLSDARRAELSELIELFLAQSELRLPPLRAYARLMREHLQRASFHVGEVAERLYRLKTTARAGWVRRRIEGGESVADHSFGAYVLGLLYLPETEPSWDGYDKREVLDTILIHDLAEAVIGDLLPHEQNDETKRREAAEFDYLGMLSTYRQLGDLERVRTLWRNFEQRSSPNGRIARDLDKLENLFQLCVYRKSGHDIEDLQVWVRDLVSHIDTPAGRQILAIIRGRFAAVLDSDS